MIKMCLITFTCVYQNMNPHEKIRIHFFIVISLLMIIGCIILVQKIFPVVCFQEKICHSKVESVKSQQQVMKTDGPDKSFVKGTFLHQP